MSKLTKLTALTKTTTGLNSGATLLAEKMETGSIATSNTFKSLIPINENDLREITQSMKDNGYDLSKPLHIWKEKGILVDGHTRLAAAIAAGIAEVPVYKHSFETEDEAVEYAIKEQLNRRNLDEAGKLKLVAKLYTLKTPGRKATGGATEKGKSSTRLAKELGTSPRTVERMVAVLKDDEEKEAVYSGEKSINKAYNDIKKKKQEQKSSQKVATEDDLNDLPFTSEELSASDTKEEGKDSLDAFDVFYDEEEVAGAETSWTNSGSTVEFHDDDEVDYATDWHIGWGTLCILKAALEYEQEHHDDGYGGARRKALKKVKELLNCIKKKTGGGIVI